MSRNQTSYQAITDSILELLQAGVVPWRKPWNTPGSEPQNLLTRKFYRGINPLMLNCQPYGSPFWLTYRQAHTLGGQVRKGQRATTIWFWKLWSKKDPNRRPGEISSAELRTFPVLRRWSVFNAEQCDGLDLPELPADTRSELQRIKEAQSILDNMPNPPTLEHGGRGAVYCEGIDTVRMPDRHHFESSESYYSILFHELTHSTGHSTRLDRKLHPLKRSPSNDFCREELVAEMGAAFLAGAAGIAPATLESSASYLDYWIKRLRGDSTLVMRAAGQAQKAADHILDLSPPEAKS